MSKATVSSACGSTSDDCADIPRLCRLRELLDATAARPLREDSLLTFSRGTWSLVEAEPELRTILDGVRKAFSRQIVNHYGGSGKGASQRSVAEFTRQNRADWDADAAALLATQDGNRSVKAPPWLWEGIFGEGVSLNYVFVTVVVAR